MHFFAVLRENKYLCSQHKPVGTMMEEKLLHYVWKHRLWPASGWLTTRGETIEVVDPGLWNHGDQGPDFFNAKLRIDGQMWVGNVEMHVRASDWTAHHHHTDPIYNNVVLHVVATSDCDDLQTSDGRRLPQAVLPLPASLLQGYERLLSTMHYPPCYEVIPTLPALTQHAWMAAMATERLEQKTKAVARRAAAHGDDWESACFITLARCFGFGINSEAMEQWAQTLRLDAVAHHRDDLTQVEAFFLGHAGLLERPADDGTPAPPADDYQRLLLREWRFLSGKFGLQPIDPAAWRYLRLRPQNFPHIRLSQLAVLYHERRLSLSAITEQPTAEAVMELLSTGPSAYWQDHYSFGGSSRHQAKRLSRPSLQSLVINGAVPMLFAVGRHRRRDDLADRAFDWLEQLPAEDNSVVRLWQQCGLRVSNAQDSQALIQLRRQYCDRRDCLRCRFGYEYLKRVKNE